jgi:hypothetical protein
MRKTKRRDRWYAVPEKVTEEQSESPRKSLGKQERKRERGSDEQLKTNEKGKKATIGFSVPLETSKGTSHMDVGCPRQQNNRRSKQKE